jgi:2-deoxy-D-gluconate 3-dehydrogenase
MAKELASHGILVNAVVPGGVTTPGAVATGEEIMKITGQMPKDIEDELTNYMTRIPVNRVAEPEEIGNVVLFLASPASNYMVGSVVIADGGVLLT